MDMIVRFLFEIFGHDRWAESGNFVLGGEGRENEMMGKGLSK